VAGHTEEFRCLDDVAGGVERVVAGQVAAGRLLDADSLPDPDIIAQEIADDLRSALEQ
jgi:hypothetical protein